MQHILQGKIEFVPQLNPHEPQLLFPSVPSKIVVQTLKETEDKLESANIEHGLNTTQFVDEDMEMILTLHHAALKIRGDVKNISKYNNCASVSTEDASELVPQSLYLFLSVLLTGYPEE